MEVKLFPLLLIKLLENMAQMQINGRLPNIAPCNYPNFPTEPLAAVNKYGLSVNKGIKQNLGILYVERLRKGGDREIKEHGNMLTLLF